MGIDSSPIAIKVVSEELGMKAIQLEAERVDCLGETFDVVTMFSVIEYLTNPRLVLEKIRAVLRPDGVVGCRGWGEVC
jgi:2-polyprenyl-3-methyl-5-hydroxy-6-metoxy-1,4-benzoquinol methylase